MSTTPLLCSGPADKFLLMQMDEDEDEVCSGGLVRVESCRFAFEAEYCPSLTPMRFARLDRLRGVDSELPTPFQIDSSSPLPSLVDSRYIPSISRLFPLIPDPALPPNSPSPTASTQHSLLLPPNDDAITSPVLLRSGRRSILRFYVLLRSPSLLGLNLYAQDEESPTLFAMHRFIASPLAPFSEQASLAPLSDGGLTRLKASARLRIERDKFIGVACEGVERLIDTMLGKDHDNLPRSQSRGHRLPDLSSELGLEVLEKRTVRSDELDVSSV
jgi:hypothetical protein